MKKLLKLSALLLFVFQFSNLIAQDIVAPKPEKNVPIIVAEAFQTKFSKMEPVWFTQFQGRYNDKLVYEARFIFDKRYSSAVYNRDGTLIAFAATIEANEIPQKAIDYMKKNYTDRGITDAMMVTRGEKEVTFELGLFISNRFTVVVFDKEGNYIKTTLG